MIFNDLLKAVKSGIYRRLAANSYRKASHHYTQKNYLRAMHYAELAAGYLHPDAMMMVALLYFNGLGVENDDEKAFRFFMVAVVYGNYEAKYYVGMMYYHGTGTAQDYESAYYWLDDFVKDELSELSPYYAEACFQIGVMCFTGQGIKKEVNCSLDYFLKAAEKQYAPAMYELGYLFYNGLELEKDDQKAFYWFTKSAALNNAQAQCSLGVMYFQGDGIPVDPAKAIELLTLSANQNNVNAQLSLGKLFYHYKDFENAYRYFEMAALNNDDEAQFCLGKFFFEGQGTEPDFKKASYWLEKAAASQHKGAQEFIRDNVKSMNMALWN